MDCKLNEHAIRNHLQEIPRLQQEANGFLIPGRSGSGSPSTERSIGFNVNALDYSMARDTIRALHKWEILIRKGRNLTPPALLKRKPTIEAEVAASAKFHIAHLQWTIKQDFACDFAAEIKEIHNKGLSICKEIIQKPTKIPCPTDKCSNHVVVDVTNILAGVTCYKCRTSWTIYRLLSLAMTNPNRTFFLDIDAICVWLNLSQKEVLKIINSNEIVKKNGLYDIAAISKVRNLS